MNEYIFFGLFTVFIILILLVDLGVFSKENHVISFKEAAIWSIFWICLALGFWVFLDYYGELIHGVENYADVERIVNKYIAKTDRNGILVKDNLELSVQNYRDKMSLDFITGYLLEYSLSVDNIFVIILIFSSFGVAEKYYKKVLFWGILGAILMRFLFIFVGATIIEHAHWVLYIFGAFLIFTGGKMFYEFIKGEEDEEIDTDDSWVVKWASKIFNVYPRYVGSHFFIPLPTYEAGMLTKSKFNKKNTANSKRHSKKRITWAVTPLFIVVLVIEFTDLIFAVDSIPAIFAVTQDPYVVFFSNIFAILGLRSMFFFLSNIMHLFHYLKLGLAFLLSYIGLKMLAASWLKALGFTNQHSIFIILGILGISVLASIIFPQKEEETPKKENIE
ncbi:integral membrane protein, TerC family [Bernardetia litoralis DSM 6794]|uniref:Integral membrane protein, TerC family n=1 Tax=Bernardetia litoralis (strain ATCC 23117 / DSM 6794 / NBRC 15988 / NCIMB 1366 / Fx l1 / Sio-4) TaxID=880071 RepID=I4AFW2_BERLS|nr:TerC/Alx family metal homeostasis membrane protein [Bernardetia litoralis]AFM02847.1 integral membrane protein, TerC family [Bernardetia litoralis DSM 6794]